MSLLSAIILGIVQGLTEFLPVSSSGHLTVFQHFLGEIEASLTFDIAVHVGTVLSVLTIYNKTIRNLISDIIKGCLNRELNGGSQLALWVIIGTIPAGLVGVFFKSHIEAMFESLWVVTVGFTFTSLLLFFSRNKGSGKMGSDFLELNGTPEIHWRQALLVGCAQAFAIIPGVSRAGSTIAMGLIVGMDRKTSALFSFMLAIPAILGAAVLQLGEVNEFGSHELQVLLTGILVSYVVGMAGLKLVLAFVKEGRMHYFSYYLWALILFLSFYQLKG